MAGPRKERVGVFSILLARSTPRPPPLTNGDDMEAIRIVLQWVVAVGITVMLCVICLQAIAMNSIWWAGAAPIFLILAQFWYGTVYRYIRYAKARKVWL